MGSRRQRGPVVVDNTILHPAGNLTFQMVNGAVEIWMNTSAGPTTCTLPVAPVLGQQVTVKDSSGAASTNPITVVPGGAITTIDGQASIVMNVNYECIGLMFNGTEWAIENVNVTGAGGLSNLLNGVEEGAHAGQVGASTRIIKTLLALADNTTGTLFTITVPNAIAGGAVRVTVTGTLGDGDSTDSAIYTIGVSRIAGANAKAVASAKSVVGATAGATGNAVVTVAVPAVTGAVGAVNTFLVTGKVARSAGTSTGHNIVAEVELLGTFGGCTIS